MPREDGELFPARRAVGRASAGRCAALPLVLAAFMAACMAGGDAAAQPGAAPASQRIREAVTDPARSTGGSFFSQHERIMAEASPPGADETLARVRVQLEAADGDALAETYIRSLDGVRSAEITVGVVRAAIGSDPAVLEPALKKVWQEVVMPDGQSARLPVRHAYALHSWLLRKSSDLLHRRSAPAELAGVYTASLDGACPFPPGALALVQRGPLLECQREGRLLCSLALGERGGTAVAEEVRYLSRNAAGGGDPAIVVPDQPSQIYRLTREDGGGLRLDGQARTACRIVLRREP